MKATLKLEDGREISVEVTEDDIAKMKASFFKKGDTAYYILLDGRIDSEKIYDAACYAEGFAFHSEKEAEAERMRILSRQKRFDWKPLDGETYYSYMNYGKVGDGAWIGCHADCVNWHMGNCHNTKEEAEEWGRTYAKYFFD